MCYNIGTGRKSVMLGSAYVAPRADLRMVFSYSGAVRDAEPGVQRACSRTAFAFILSQVYNY